MKKIFGFIAAALVMASCAEETGKLIKPSKFEKEVDGKAVSLYTLKAGDLTMQVTNYGARVVSLWAPDRDGNVEDIVLGYRDIDEYLENKGERFLGAAVGPYANRIADGSYTIDGKEYNFPKNDGNNTLHGGFAGLDRVVWDVAHISDSLITLSYFHEDGQEGKPGNVTVMMVYSLNCKNEFSVYYFAQSDKKTHVNLTHHSFFNLKGEGNGSINDHELYINASKMTPVNDRLIPTGELADVEGTPFDFRQAKTIGQDLDMTNEQLANAGGYDHNWVIDRTDEDDEVVLAASVYEPVSGRYMEVWTDQPGIQFYGGNFFNGQAKGKYGKPHAYREAFALETQKFPDSPNHPDFPSTLVYRGAPYHHRCVYSFGVK